MEKIIINPNINPSIKIKNVNHLYPIDVSLSRTLVEKNYGIGTDKDTIKDLRDLFFNGVKDPLVDSRLTSDGSERYGYSNYDENNIDKIPTTVSYGKFRKIVDQIDTSNEYKRKTNLVEYYNNIVFGDFVLNYYSGAIKLIYDRYMNSEVQLKAISNSTDQIVKSYIQPVKPLSSFYKFLHVKNAPADLCAYMNIRGILFKMNKISDTEDSTEFEFQYPAFLLEQYADMYNSVLNISFNKTAGELENMEIYGSNESCVGNISVSTEGFTGLNYFKKF